MCVNDALEVVDGISSGAEELEESVEELESWAITTDAVAPQSNNRSIISMNADDPFANDN